MLRRSAAHVIVAAVEAPELEPDDAHHLAAVLRLRPGEIVTATDGRGSWRVCRWRSPATLEPDGPVHTEPRPEPAITIGVTPVKGDRPEWAVQKLTELGVDEIVILRTARSVVRWDARREGPALERLRAVVRAAAMQSRRVHVPPIVGVRTPAEIAGAALAEMGGDPPTLERPVVLIGPEGGWDPAELAGRPTVGLGPHVLRAETAALAAAVRLAALREQPRSVVGWYTMGRD